LTADTSIKEKQFIEHLLYTKPINMGTAAPSKPIVVQFQNTKRSNNDRIKLPPFIDPPPNALYAGEFPHMEQLGLGRGINATSPNLWAYKTPWQVRSLLEWCPDDPVQPKPTIQPIPSTSVPQPGAKSDEPKIPKLRNCIATDEVELTMEYTHEVSSLKSQQSKISVQLMEPTSKISLGMDANNSQTYSSTVTIKGKRDC